MVVGEEGGGVEGAADVFGSCKARLLEQRGADGTMKHGAGGHAASSRPTITRTNGC